MTFNRPLVSSLISFIAEDFFDEYLSMFDDFHIEMSVEDFEEVYNEYIEEEPEHWDASYPEVKEYLKKVKYMTARDKAYHMIECHNFYREYFDCKNSIVY